MRHALAALFALGLALPAAAQTLERIAATGEIRLGVRADAAPLSYMRDGAARGYAVDLCLGVMDHIEKEALRPGAKVPLKPVFVTVTAENRFDKLVAGEVDMLCGPDTASLSRRERVDFSLPTYIDGAAVMTRADGVTDFASLAGKRIGVRAGTTTQTALESTLRQMGMQAEVVAVTDHAAGLSGVLDGSVAAYFADQSILFGLVLGSGRQAELRVAENAMTIEPHAIGLRRGDSDFRLAVDRGLSRLYRSGAVRRIFTTNFAPATMGQAMQMMLLLAPLPE